MAPRIPRAWDEPKLDFSPLVDLSFLLLVYFLVTSTLDPAEADLSMSHHPGLSRAGSAFVPDPMQIEVNAAGHVLADGEVLDTDPRIRAVPLLLDRLRDYAAGQRLVGLDPAVVLSADDASKGQRFVDVLNALGDPAVAIRNVALAGFASEGDVNHSIR